MINSKYSKNYESKNAHGIEHNGSQYWFYVGFYDPDDCGHDENGDVWYLISSNASDDCEYILDDNGRRIAINEDRNYIRNHTFDVTSCGEYYRNQATID
jgi:hypothetical protein